MDLNRLNNSNHEARQRYENTRRDTQSQDSNRVRGARRALVRLSEMRAERIRQGRTRASASHIAETQEHHKAHHADQIEISDRARIMAREHAQMSAGSNDEPARAEKVAELKAKHAQGNLNSPEAIGRAAENMLRHAE